MSKDSSLNALPIKGIESLSEPQVLFDLIMRYTNDGINIVENPLTCVVLGTGKILENISHFEPVLMRSAKR